jgi:presenilin-like A22 family membrane protease
VLKLGKCSSVIDSLSLVWSVSSIIFLVRVIVISSFEYCGVYYVFMVLVFICVLCVYEVGCVVFMITITCVLFLYRVQGWYYFNRVGVGVILF